MTSPVASFSLPGAPSTDSQYPNDTAEYCVLACIVLHSHDRKDWGAKLEKRAVFGRAPYSVRLAQSIRQNARDGRLLRTAGSYSNICASIRELARRHTFVRPCVVLLSVSRQAVRLQTLAQR
jgi:hypothetical protein